VTVQPAARPSLREVTLVAVTSVAIQATVNALKRSTREVDFRQVLLLSHEEPTGELPQITWRKIDRLKSRADYSHFMLHHLAEHICTTHALCVQWDGYVLNGAAWDNSFLEYDYIGAVWPHFADAHNVGNGGFSLRSRRLLELCNGLPNDGRHAEDIVIGRLYRPQLEVSGIRFAPASVANRFAFERSSPTGNEFGFHGAYNLVRYLTRRDAMAVFRELDSRMLANNERREILNWALARGRLNLARLMLARRSPEVS
jgi:hypothetical protein